MSRCSVCRRGNAYLLKLRTGTAALCPYCIKALDEWFTAVEAKARKWKAEARAEKLRLFREAMFDNIYRKGRVYASSLGWRLGLTRAEVRREVVKLAKAHGWKVEKTPSNHIIVSEEGVGKVAEVANNA